MERNRGGGVVNMNRTRLVSVLALLAACQVVTSSRITMDQDGGYKRIVVKISKDVPEAHCPTLLKNIKEMFEKASHVLNNALDNQVYFKAVTVVVPSTWRDGQCQETITAPKGDTPYWNADIKIEAGHPVHEDGPFTQQSQGCGIQGDFIQLSEQFMMDLNATESVWGSPAKLFVKEWAKFRYGVFDEYGFSGDHLYPNHFFHHGKILPTGETNAPLNGLWLNSNGQTGCYPGSDRDCYFHFQGRNNGLMCSLGYLHFLPNVTRFCSKGQYEPMAPTKQNIVCGGKSSYQVIKEHPDFSRVHTTVADLSPAELHPTFEVIREPLQQYVLVMETSASMDNEDQQWEWISKAAQKFIRYDLPVNSNLAIITFSNTSKIEHAMTQVHSDKVRAQLADTIPDKYHLSSSNERCVLCALQKAVHDVVRDNQAGTHIILMTQGSPDTLSLTDEKVVQGYATDLNVKLSTILLPANERLLPFYDEAGYAYVVDNANSIVDYYTKINEAFSSILASDPRYPSELPLQVHKNVIDITATPVTTGTFLVDSTLGRDTVFGIYVEDEDDHLIESVTFTDSKGKVFGPFSRMSSTYDSVNYKTINFPPGKAPPFNSLHQIGNTWQYTIKWHLGKNLPATNDKSNKQSIVSVTSKPRQQSDKGLITVESWTSHEEGRNATGNHLAVYVKVQRGQSPVAGAKVTARLEVSHINGTTLEFAPLELLDDGFADPDMMAGDGIYSRNLQHHLTTGRYKFTLSVDDNEGKAYYLTSPPPRQATPTTSSGDQRHLMLEVTKRRCCGSSVASSPSQRSKTGLFRRTGLDGPVVHVQSPDYGSGDYLPPARIGDFRVNPIPNTANKLLATWTAPGGDGHVGMVASYKFVMSDDIAKLVNPQADQADVLLGFDRLEQAGTKAKFDFSFPHFDQDYYVGVYSYDASGNRGKISNLVHVRIPSPPGRSSKGSAGGRGAADVFGDIFDADADGEPDWVMIGAIAGVIGMLLLLGIVVIVYYFVVSRRGKKNAKSGSASSVILNGGGSGSAGSGTDETDSSSFDSDIKNIMAANPLGPALHASRPGPRNLQYKSPGGQAPPQPPPPAGLSQGSTPSDSQTDSTTVTPVYWSASQLLSKLDHGGSGLPGHYHGNPYVNSSSDGLYGLSSGHYVPNGPQSLQQLSSPHHVLHHVPNQPPSLMNNNSSYPYGVGEVWQGGYHLHHASAGISDYQLHSEIPEEYTITVGNLNHEQSDSGDRHSDPSKSAGGKPRNITQV